MDNQKTERDGSSSFSSPFHGSETFIDAIDHQRRLFSGLRTDLFAQYLERDRKSPHQTPKLVSMNGWGDSLRLITHGSTKPKLSKQAIQKLFRGEDNIERWGGYWTFLGGQGIAINPGNDFLQRFHESELHIWDIDHVIVTDGNVASSIDLERLWTLNKEINSLLRDWGLEPHVIHYWLHPKAFERYATKMRPHFRQEQGTLHRLDIFYDGHPFEKVQLSSGLDLVYMAPGLTKERMKEASFQASSFHETPYAIRLEEKEVQTEGRLKLSLGFFLHTPWNESLQPLIEGIDGAVLGVGELSFEEIAKLSSDEKGLGYSGALSFVSTLLSSQANKVSSHMPLLLFAEYGMREGDFRIECIKQLKADAIKKSIEKGLSSPLSQGDQSALRVIPAEETLTISLDNQILLSAPGLDEPIHVNDIAVFRSQGPFSRLTYINKSNVL